MNSVNIASFKAQLGKFLGRVRKGEEIVILDRKTPVARLIPYAEKLPVKVAVRRPLEDPASLSRLSFQPLKKKSVDTLKVLLEDRTSR